MMNLLHNVKSIGLNVTEVDKLTIQLLVVLNLQLSELPTLLVWILCSRSKRSSRFWCRR